MGLKFIEDQLVNDCNVCHNTRHIRNTSGLYVRCSCISEFSAAKLMYKKGWNQNLVLYDASKFKVKSQHQQNLIKKIADIVSSKDYSKSLFIYSLSIDRDILSAILIKRMLMSDSNLKTLEKVSLNDLVDSYFNKSEDSDSSNNEILESCDILQITVSDGLINTAHTSLLYNLLYNRILNGKFTVLLSNMPFATFNSVFKEKTEYLLKENYNFFNC